MQTVGPGLDYFSICFCIAWFIRHRCKIYNFSLSRCVFSMLCNEFNKWTFCCLILLVCFSSLCCPYDVNIESFVIVISRCAARKEIIWLIYHVPHSLFTADSVHCADWTFIIRILIEELATYVEINGLKSPKCLIFCLLVEESFRCGKVKKFETLGNAA